MISVGTDSADVEIGLLSGMLRCPTCDGELGPWGYGRFRLIRMLGSTQFVKPRRSRCRVCKKTHILLPNDLLVRRRDGVEVIGDALVMASGDPDPLAIAIHFNRALQTVRGWLSRFGSGAGRVREHFSRWAVSLDSESFEIPPAGSAFNNAIAAISAAGNAAVRKGIAVSPWQFASAVTINGLLSNTTSFWPDP